MPKNDDDDDFHSIHEFVSFTNSDRKTSVITRYNCQHSSGNYLDVLNGVYFSFHWGRGECVICRLQLALLPDRQHIWVSLTGGQGRPLSQFSPSETFPLPEIWSQNNRKINITKEIYKTIHPRKIFPQESQHMKVCHGENIKSSRFNLYASFHFMLISVVMSGS